MEHLLSGDDGSQLRLMYEIDVTGVDLPLGKVHFIESQSKQPKEVKRPR